MQASAPRARSLILYTYGAFGRRIGGWLAVADLIRLMRGTGLEAPAVRTAISRLKRDGLISAVKRAGTAGYGLSAHGWRILEEGDSRILSRRAPADLTEGWVVVVFSVPEARRSLRHQLRRELDRHGFGTLSPGVWLAPRRQRREIDHALEVLGARDFVDLLEARYEGLEEARHLVAKAWDLRSLGLAYTQLLEVLRPVRRQIESRTLDAGQAFAAYIYAIAAWRKLPYLDPGLPSEVLPADWPGDEARWLYFSLIADLDDAALAYVRAISTRS